MRPIVAGRCPGFKSPGKDGSEQGFASAAQGSGTRDTRDLVCATDTGTGGRQLTALAGGIAWAAIPGAGTIDGCYQKNEGEAVAPSPNSAAGGLKITASNGTAFVCAALPIDPGPD